MIRSTVVQRRQGAIVKLLPNEGASPDRIGGALGKDPGAAAQTEPRGVSRIFNPSERLRYGLPGVSGQLVARTQRSSRLFYAALGSGGLQIDLLRERHPSLSRAAASPTRDVRIRSIPRLRSDSDNWVVSGAVNVSRVCAPTMLSRVYARCKRVPEPTPPLALTSTQ